MSQKPPGVMLYPQDLLPLVSHLPPDAAGRLLSAILNYSAFGVVPPMDGPEQWVWPAIKDRIDRDREAYNEKCERARANGKRGGRPRKNQEEEPEDEPGETEENQEEPDGFFNNPLEPEETEGNPEEPEKANNNNNYNPNSNYNSNGYSSPRGAPAPREERNVENPVEKQIAELRERLLHRMKERYNQMGIGFQGNVVESMYRLRMNGISRENELLILKMADERGYDQLPDPEKWLQPTYGAEK